MERVFLDLTPPLQDKEVIFDRHSAQKKVKTNHDRKENSDDKKQDNQIKLSNK